MRYEQEQTHNVTDAVIYCRVSSKAQTKRGDGLSSQETRCRQYADYKGYHIKKVFTDDLTGQSIDRPGLQAMLSYLRSDRRNPHVVIVDDITRFARNVRVHFDLREAILEVGGILESPSIELRDDADGELHEYILASVSQHQSRKNREQTINRMKARVMNGYWPFQPPIGFKHQKQPGGPGKVLVRHEPIASIIHEALEGYASGRLDTQSEVKRFLENQPEFPKDYRGTEVRYQRVAELLQRPVYAGYVEAPKWDVPLREGKHEGLIDLATYQMIQDRLKGGARVPARKDLNQDFPLRGFILCGDCEKPLTACWSKSKTGKRHPYYLCHNRSCESRRKSIKRDDIEGAFSELVKRMTPTQELFALAKVMFKKAWEIRTQQAEAIETSMQAKIVKVDRQIEQLVDRIVDSESDTAIAAYEKRIAKLEREKLIASEKLKSGIGPKRSFSDMFELACSFLANPWKLWASDRLEDKRTVLKLAFSERLTYSRKTGLRTPKTTLPFKMLGDVMTGNCKMAHRGGFEPPTPRFVV